MKYLVAVIYYSVIGAAILLVVVGLFPSWEEIRFPTLYFGFIMIFFYTIGIIRGILHYRKTKRMGLTDNVAEEEPEDKSISELLAEARTRAIDIKAPNAVVIEISQAFMDFRHRYCNKETSRKKLDVISQLLTLHSVEDEELHGIIGECYNSLRDE